MADDNANTAPVATEQPSEGRDIEEAVHAQGFLPEGQDMVEAIHGTSNVSSTSKFDFDMFSRVLYLLISDTHTIFSPIVIIDQVKVNDGKGIGLCILVLLITSFILSFTPI